jgi:hypothetical protein
MKEAASWPFPTFPVKVDLFPFIPATKAHKADLATKVKPLGEVAKDCGINILHVFDRLQPLAGGVTIAYKKASEDRSCRMVEVSVAYCVPGDSYNKKIGIDLAVQRFLDGSTVTVPARVNKDDETIPMILIARFS